MGSPVTVDLGYWLNALGIQVKWELIFDSLTVSMLLPVMIISTCVQLYSQEYLKEDPHLPRFFTYLSLFTFAMLMLVTGENLFIMFLGWESVGIVSYLLVNYWFTGVSNNHAAMKALFMNKIGDWAFILVISLAITIFGDLSLPTLFSLGHLINND